MHLNLDQEFYIILCDYDQLGLSFEELDLEDTGKDNLFERLAEASNPVAVIYFNPVEGHSRDVSEDIAREWLNKLTDAGDIEVDDFGVYLPAFIRLHHPDIDTIEREMIEDFQLHQQSPESLYGCPARI